MIDRSICEEMACGRLIIDCLYDGCIQPSTIDLRLSARADRLYRCRQLGSRNEGQTEPSASLGHQDIERKPD